ncbi:hypothetical protein [Sphingomonas alba]|uniref:Uncharacterized protein n=1 Tax=Sphingomonas alba TaxID=2908208 RepID=A0ABT0RP43_9SPHN|nr:hypothetical protein [Sphingomonas alba]MCL6684411.1 hypothetical protein [Sphingomonas alba]
MRLVVLSFAALFVASPLAAKPLTVHMGETWIFAVAHGQPAKARKVDAKIAPSTGEMKVSLSSLMGTTMTIANNSEHDYAYRATLVLAEGKAGPAKSCAVPANGRLAIEHWPQKVAAIRLSDFKPAPAGSLCP